MERKVRGREGREGGYLKKHRFRRVFDLIQIIPLLQWVGGDIQRVLARANLVVAKKREPRVA